MVASVVVPPPDVVSEPSFPSPRGGSVEGSNLSAAEVAPPPPATAAYYVTRLVNRTQELTSLNDFYPPAASVFKISQRKRSALTMAFRRCRDCAEQSLDAIADGRHLLSGITVHDIGQDADFACLVMNASLLFDALPSLDVVMHIEDSILPNVTDTAQLEALLSVFTSEEGMLRLEDLTAATSSTAVNAAGVQLLLRNSGKEGGGGGGGVVESPLSVGTSVGGSGGTDYSDVSWRLRRRHLLWRMLPTFDRFLSNMPRDLLLRILCDVVDTKLWLHEEEDGGDRLASPPHVSGEVPAVAKDAASMTRVCRAVSLFMQGVQERIDMLRDTMTSHQLSQVLLAFALSPYRTMALSESAHEWTDRLLKHIDFAMPHDLACAFFACALLQCASAEVLNACCRRLYLFVNVLDAVSIAQCVTALAMVGVKAPKLTKDLGEQLKLVDLGVMHPVLALDTATALALLGGGDDSVFALLTARILTERRLILSLPDARVKLLSLTAQLGDRERIKALHTPTWQQTQSSSSNPPTPRLRSTPPPRLPV